VSTARAELIKLVTLPALPLTVLLTWAVTAALALLPDAGPIRYARAGFVVLGVLAAASEYDGGQLRTSLLCTPRRLRLLAVKMLVLGLATVPVAVVTVLVAGGGAPLRLVSTVLLAAAVATVLRSAVAAVAVLLGYLYLLVPFVELPIDDGLWLPAAALVVAGVAFVRRDA
jgi:ABC-2 type transport system permease protein